MRRVRVSTLAKGWSPHSWMNKWNEFEKKRIRIWGSNFKWHWIDYEDGSDFYIKRFKRKLATNDIIYMNGEWSWLTFTNTIDDGKWLHEFLNVLDNKHIGKDAIVAVDTTDPYVIEFLEKVDMFEREGVAAVTAVVTGVSDNLIDDPAVP